MVAIFKILKHILAEHFCTGSRKALPLGRSVLVAPFCPFLFWGILLLVGIGAVLHALSALLFLSFLYPFGPFLRVNPPGTLALHTLHPRFLTSHYSCFFFFAMLDFVTTFLT